MKEITRLRSERDTLWGLVYSQLSLQEERHRLVFRATLEPETGWLPVSDHVRSAVRSARSRPRRSGRPPCTATSSAARKQEHVSLAGLGAVRLRPGVTWPGPGERLLLVPSRRSLRPHPQKA